MVAHARLAQHAQAAARRGAAAGGVLLRAGLGGLTLWAVYAATAPAVRHGPYAAWESRPVLLAVISALLLISLATAVVAALRDGLRASGVPPVGAPSPVDPAAAEREVTGRVVTRRRAGEVASSR